MKKYLLGFLLVTFAHAILAQDLAADALVKSITDDVLATMRQSKDTGNPRRVAELVETKVLPHFDFVRMTQLALAVNWRRATPEQQKALTQEFRTLLVRTYSTALASYRDQAVDFKPLRARPEDAEVTVRTEIKQRGAQPLAIDYEMEKTSSGWKVFDVKVGGVSLITTYKDDFSNQIRENGMDGLIKTLSVKNRQGDVRPKAS
jgi:phospholipid transport system substrate-binding protein